MGKSFFRQMCPVDLILCQLWLHFFFKDLYIGIKVKTVLCLHESEIDTFVTKING